MRPFILSVAFTAIAASNAVNAKSNRAVLKEQHTTGRFFKQTGQKKLLGHRLIQTAEWTKWLPQHEVDKLIAAPHHNFMDITDQKDMTLRNGLLPKAQYGVPAEPRLQSLIMPLLKHLSTENMRANLEPFTEFFTRYYKSESGVDSANWLYEKISGICAGRHDIKVTKFAHAKWDQFSIIARFEPESSDVQSNNAKGTVIVSAHQDSISGFIFQKKNRSPGADDDGSGTMTILEAFKVLVEQGYEPDVPLEFHWYSAEEAGLLGSQDVASSYVNAERPVIAMVQMDMTGYTGKQNVVGLVTDYTTPEVTDFHRKLIGTYLTIPYRETKCGYACSDHAPWFKAGYPASFTIESEFDKSSPYIHKKQDTVEHIDFDHMKEFAKLTLSFAVECTTLDPQGA